MTLIELLKVKQLDARKERNSVETNFYTTLIGDAVAIGKNAGNRAPTDDEVLNLIKKYLKNVEQVLSVTPVHDYRAGVAATEEKLLKSFIPMQLTREQLSQCLQDYLALGGIRNMKDIMNYFKQNHPNMYDGKVLSAVVKEAL